MARHHTRKDGEDGKRATLDARRAKVRKYHVPPVDLKALERELRRERRK